ncbi:hexokinase [Desulfotomaculum defluvii]
MTVLKDRMRELEQAFNLTTHTVCEIARDFKMEMLAGRSGQGSLKMLHTYIAPPTGKERGDYVAIDFGGTNIRIQLISLMGAGHYKVKKTSSFALQDPAGTYDYTSEKTSAEELFDFIAQQIADLTKDCSANLLGHTFSFPTQQINMSKAILLNWTKEIKTGGIEGMEVTSFLEAALARVPLKHLKPVAILNDTTATLLTAAYMNPYAHIGSICGTGHNTCYLEFVNPLGKAPMIINLESGNFNKFPLTVFDKKLDEASEKPNQQLLEKAVSGRYIGEITHLIIKDLLEEKLLFIGNDRAIDTVKSISAPEIALIIEDQTLDLSNVANWVKERWDIQASRKDLIALKQIASMVTLRAARLIAATFIGILLHLDPELKSRHVIGIDGSMFQKMPYFVDRILKTINEAFQDKNIHIKMVHIYEGSSIGAALAAASYSNSIK